MKKFGIFAVLLSLALVVGCPSKKAPTGDKAPVAPVEATETTTATDEAKPDAVEAVDATKTSEVEDPLSAAL